MMDADPPLTQRGCYEVPEQKGIATLCRNLRQWRELRRFPEPKGLRFYSFGRSFRLLRYEGP